jgi:hypothetical protein
LRSLLLAPASCIIREHCYAKNTARLPLQTYLHDSGTQISALQHHVHVTGIPYGTPIYYKCAHAPHAESLAWQPCLPPLQ